ncbi:tubulin domain-containing protein [Kalaharituber pfeilii]|nr:tubulin domain-containing protein [Kalaharituber pfeilii]
MHEVLTLQLGHSANYIATHFWNTQQSYFTFGADSGPVSIDHDVHFRAGIGTGGVETYTPRTLIYDLKGGFGSMKRINALYELEEDLRDNYGEIWNNNVIVQKEPEIGMHPYIESLELGTELPPITAESVRYWNDFNSVYYHPRSIIQLYQYEAKSGFTPFDNNADGRELFTSIDNEYEILDRDIRFFAEECDQMQGIQIFTTTDDGWGGFASEYVIALRDEYPKTELWTWGIERSERVPIEKRVPRTLGLANALSVLVPLSSIYVPIRSPPAKVPSYITFDHVSQWHTSALISTGIETITLQTRMKGPLSGSRLNDLSTVLTVNSGRNISLLSMEVLDGRHINSPTGNAGAATEEHIVDLSWTGEEKHTFAKVKVARGAGDPDLNGRPDTATQHHEIPERCALLAAFHAAIPYPLLESYPNIFGRPGGSLSLACSLRTSSLVIDRLGRIRDTVLRFAPLDQKEVLYNELSGLSSAYEEGWDSGSDSGEDD